MVPRIRLRRLDKKGICGLSRLEEVTISKSTSVAWQEGPAASQPARECRFERVSSEAQDQCVALVGRTLRWVFGDHVKNPEKGWERCAWTQAYTAV